MQEKTKKVVYVQSALNFHIPQKKVLKAKLKKLKMYLFYK